MKNKAEYNGTAKVGGEETKMLTFNYSDIGGAPRSIQARSQKEADEIASRLAEDIKKQNEIRASQSENTEDK
jgi:hypothetical protein